MPREHRTVASLPENQPAGHAPPGLRKRVTEVYGVTRECHHHDDGGYDDYLKSLYDTKRLPLRLEGRAQQTMVEASSGQHGRGQGRGGLSYTKDIRGGYDVEEAYESSDDEFEKPVRCIKGRDERKM